MEEIEIDWRRMFLKCVTLVEIHETYDFLRKSDWSEGEWSAISKVKATDEYGGFREVLGWPEAD